MAKLSSTAGSSMIRYSCIPEYGDASRNMYSPFDDILAT